MRGLRRNFWGKLALAAVTVPVLIQAYEYGPEPGHAGVPGESTCTQCHTGTVNSGPGSVAVTFPGSLTYTPGAAQHLVVTVADPNQRRWGFQLTARLASDTSKPAGSFTAGADGYTQVVEGFIEHTLKAYQDSVARFEFDWTPPASDVGPVTIYVAGNAANGDLRTTGDRIYTASYTMTAATLAPPAISDLRPVISPGAWISILGTNLSATSRTWSGGDLPAELDGVSVSVNGKPAAIYSVSPGKISALAPADDTVGDVAVVVTNANGSSAPVNVRLEHYAPVFFAWGDKYAAATRLDASPIGKGAPARPGDVLILWGTGFSQQDAPVIRVGDSTAEYLGGNNAPGAKGTFLILVRLPDSAPDGDLPVSAELGGVRSPDNVFITVQH